MSSASDLTRGLRTLVLGHHRAANHDSRRRENNLTADGLVANSLLSAKPNPMATPANLSDMTWDEELPDTHWPLDDEILFYSSPNGGGGPGGGGGGGSAAQGGNSSGIYFDLNVSIPVIVPNSEIRILNSEGENYYHSTNDESVNLLFGQYVGLEHEDPEEVTAGSPVSGATTTTTSGADTTPTSLPGFPLVEEVRVEDRLPFTICDVWASFLHIQVGKIKNCRYDNIQEITEMFLETFDKINFFQPMRIQCCGIYQQSVGKTTRLETRARFCDLEDFSRFRILRRALKLFCLKLRQKFATEGESYNKQFHAALSPVCKTGAYLPIEIRRYSALDKDTLALVEGGLMTCTFPVPPVPEGATDQQAASPKQVSLQTQCLLNDIRLEMTHARAVDPRWTKSWVLCRRMPMTARIIPGRKVFANIPPSDEPKILYQFKNPKQKLTKSRFGPLYMLTESALNLASNKQQQQQQQQQQQPQHPNILADLFFKDHSLNYNNHHPQLQQQMRAEHRARKEAQRQRPDQQNIVPMNQNMRPGPNNQMALDNSQMRAEAIPFFPLTTLTQGLDEFGKTNAIIEELRKCVYIDEQTRWEEEVMDKLDQYMSQSSKGNYEQAN